MSETTGKLAEALAKAQGQFTNVGKDRDVKVKMKAGGEYTFSYATLAAIWTVIRKPLSEAGLAVVQVTTVSKEGVSVKTILMHSSGESVESACSMPVEEWNPKGIGSAISYARRYGLSAMVGVVSEDEDDDASAAQGATMTARRDTKPAPANKPTAVAMPRGESGRVPTFEAPAPALAPDPVGIEVEAVIAAAPRCATLAEYETLKPRAKALEGVASPSEYARVSAAMAARKATLTKGAA